MCDFDTQFQCEEMNWELEFEFNEESGQERSERLYQYAIERDPIEEDIPF